MEVDLTLLVEGGNNLLSILKEGFLVEVEDSTFDNIGCEVFDTCIMASKKESAADLPFFSIFFNQLPTDWHIVKHVRHFFAISPRR